MKTTNIAPLLRQYNKSFSFKKGDWVSLKGDLMLIRAAEPDYFTLQKHSNKEVINFTTDLLYDLRANGEFELASPPDLPITFGPITNQSKLLEAERRLRYINDLRYREDPGSPKTWQACVNFVSAKHNDPNPPHPKQVYRWLRSYKTSSGNIHNLLKKIQTRSTPKLDEQYDLAMEVIDDEYLIPRGGNKSHVYNRFKIKFAEEKRAGKPMSRSYFFRLIDSLDPYEVCVAQRGAKVARDLFRASDEKIHVSFMMERVEIDAVHLNLGVLDDVTGEYLGKVIVFFAIDVYTRYILSYSLVYGKSPGETSEAAIEVVRNMVLPNIRTGNYRNEWYDLGVPLRVHTDNGVGFTSENFHRFINMLGIEPHRSETGKGQRRPFIERFNRTFREQLCVKIPGYNGKRADGANFEKTVEQTAQITLSQFRAYLEEYIVDVYHQRKHKGLDVYDPSKPNGLNYMTPQEAVELALEQFVPRPAPSVEQANALLGVVEIGRIQFTQGIQIDNQHFNSPQLRELRNTLLKPGDKRSPQVDFLYNKKDISKITVLVPGSMEIIIVPNRNKTIRPGTSLDDFKRSQKQSTNKQSANELQPTFTSKHGAHKPPKKAKSDGGKKTQAANANPTDKITKMTDQDIQKQFDGATGRVANDFSEYTEVKNVNESTVPMRPSASKGRKKSSVRQ